VNFSGNYTLNVAIGGKTLPIYPQMIDELTVTLDIDRLLPTFNMRLHDATNILSQVAPYDKSANVISLEFTRSTDLSNLNRFEFDVKRRKVFNSDSYEVEGILRVPNFLTKQWQRSFTGNLKENLETMANDDMDIQDTEIGSSLSLTKTFIQPSWTNATMLMYLRDNILGNDNEAGYYCFVKNVRGAQVFVFKSISEFFVSPVAANLIVGYKEFRDFIPVTDHRIYDNSQLLADFGAKRQSYSYWDYENGGMVTDYVDLSDCPSLSEFYLVDTDRSLDSLTIIGSGRSNDFTSDFQGRQRNTFYRKNTEAIQMWAGTWGLENISPGDIVKVVFSDAMGYGEMFGAYQNSGYWLVKRVVHILGSTFMTNLLLSRGGIDTEVSTSLTESNLRKK
jgi:hypothetical protein